LDVGKYTLHHVGFLATARLPCFFIFLYCGHVVCILARVKLSYHIIIYFQTTSKPQTQMKDICMHCGRKKIKKKLGFCGFSV